jgi:monofunctional biosynthetic peptidoglycan transglycosylase
MQTRLPPSLDPEPTRAPAIEPPPAPAAPEPAPEPDPPMPRPRRSLLRRLLLAAVLLLLAVTVLPVALGRFIPVWTSSFMLRYQVERVFADKPRPPLRHDWVSWEEISTPAKLAVIAAEDQKFPEHFGFDLEAIEKAVQHNSKSRRKRGASTLTQQLAKNLFLWPERSWVRKGLEVGYTLLIEALWPKQRVLEVYLNSAEFGEGVYGVEAAARHFFGKPAARLSAHEASLLAAVLPNPRRFKVGAPSGYVQKRAAWIRGQMSQLGPQTLDGL